MTESNATPKDVTMTCDQEQVSLTPLVDQRFEIPRAEVCLLRPFARGGFGLVYQAKWRGTMVAAKILTSESIKDGAQELFQFELELMQHLHHPHIVQFLGACTHTCQPVLVTEFMHGGSLQTVLDERSPLPVEEALRYALDIAKGLAYLHGKATPVIHRDLKPGNILLTSAHEGCCKLADFGISQELTAEKLASIARCPRTASGQVLRVRSASEANTGTEAQEGASEGQGNGDGGREMEPPSEHGEFDPERAPGTFRYMAPETLRGEAYGLQVDQYSFGLIMYELFDGRQAFEDLDGLEAAKAAAFDGARPEFKNAFIPRKVKDLIVSLWHMDPLKRPKMQDVVCRLEGVERTMALPTRSQASAAGGRYSSNFGQGLSVLQGPDLFDSIFGTKQRRQIARTWNTMWGSCMPDLQPPRTLTRTAARAKQYATNELVER